MPIATVNITDSWDSWRQKTNQMIGVINTLTGAGTVLSVSSPSAGQVLIYDGSVFRNVTMSGDLTIDQNGVATAHNVAVATKGRMRFYGSMAGLY